VGTADRDRRTSFTFGDLTREHRRSRPERLAIVDGDLRLTYRELDVRVNRLADALVRIGVGRGDRIAWLGQNSARVVELLVAASKLGAIFCPVNWRSSEPELRFVLADLEPAVVVWQDEEVGAAPLAARAAGAASSAVWLQHDAEGDGSYEQLLSTGEDDDRDEFVAGDDALLAMYTAAFGGTANAALLSHTALLVQNLVIGRAQDITDETVFLNSGPLFHMATFMSTNATLHHGGVNVFVRRADPAGMCDVIEAERCTHAVIMGPTLEAIIEINRQGDRDLTSLWPTGDPNDNRSTIVTPDSAPWRWRPGGYGQTEVMGLTTFLAPGSTPIGRAGRPGPAVGLRIVDEAGRDVPADGVGEILVRGLTVMSGYWRRDELNAERDGGGWHRTNDLGRRESDGSITFVGPKVAMIKSAAENIYPAEVEAGLTAHAAVRETCVIGVPDPTWTQRVHAVVVLADGYEPSDQLAAELIEHCRSRMASYKKPAQIVFVDSLPRTAVGFVDRDAVDARFGGGNYPGST
jgi:long-chain acyl-CoA synthetase